MARTDTLNTAVTDEEAELVREVARREGVTVSSWIRRVVLRAAVDEAHRLADAEEDEHPEEATG